MRGLSRSSDGERQTAADGVYRSLRRDLITLRHRPGAPLTEGELASVYGTSRVPVREACRRLQQEGLLRSLPYKGYFVHQISLKEIGDCFDLRLVLESYSLGVAAARASSEDLDALESLAATEYTYHDVESYADFLDRNLEFHVQLAALSHNRRLVTTLQDLLASMQRFFFLGLDLGDFGAEMRGEHEALVVLLRRGATDEAVHCLRGQITASRDRILRAVVKDRIDLPLE